MNKSTESIGESDERLVEDYTFDAAVKVANDITAKVNPSNVDRESVLAESDDQSLPDSESSPDVGQADASLMLKRFVRFEQRESVAIMIIAVLAVLYALYVSRAITLPITFALLLALTLRPVVRYLRKYRIPTNLGALLIIGVLIFGCIVSIYRVVGPARAWADDFPKNVKLLKEKLAPIQERFSGISESSEVIKEVTTEGNIEPISVQIKQSSLSNNMAVMSKTGNVIGSMLLVLSLTFFMLAYGDDITNSVLHLLNSYSSKKRAVSLIHGIEEGIASYLFTVTIINACLGGIVAIAMWICGLPNPLLWGFMAFAFNYIPILGALGGSVIILAVSFLTFESMIYAFVPPICFLTLTSIEGNFLTPAILGRKMKLNPILVFIALIFWGWAWGLGGAVLAVPLLAITKIACEGFEKTQPIAILLGDTIEPGDAPD